ncbi:MAG: CCA tRNA nucleotidyltransferase [Pirellulales bacterium]
MSPARSFAVEVVRKLRAAGYEALFAGGCVRDRLLGNEPSDYDVATNAVPEQIQAVFGRRKTLAIGAAFGVIAVVGPKEAGAVEVATFRRDLGYSDGRRPDGVAFCSAEEDALRRDFTINGMFFDPLDERVIDYVGGERDLGLGVIRAIGDPRARFTEDKLRLLRGVRFAARFGFALEDATCAAIRELAPRVVDVSVERIAEELRKMLSLLGRVGAIETLRDVGLLQAVVPEWANAFATEQGDMAWIAMLDELRFSQELEFAPVLARLFAPLPELLRTVPKASTVAMCRRLKLSNDETDVITWLVVHQDALRDADALPWSEIQPLLIHRAAGDLVEWSRVCACATRPFDRRRRLVRRPDDVAARTARSAAVADR